MKNIFLSIIGLFLSIMGFSQSHDIHSQGIEGDTICIPIKISAKIIDNINYLKQYERYSIVCDSLLIENEKRANYFGSQVLHLENQISALNQSNQYRDEKILALENKNQLWQNFATKKDLQVNELQNKIKKQKKIIIILSGVVMVAVTTTIVIIAVK